MRVALQVVRESVKPAGQEHAGNAVLDEGELLDDDEAAGPCWEPVPEAPRFSWELGAGVVAPPQATTAVIASAATSLTRMVYAMPRGEPECKR